MPNKIKRLLCSGLLMLALVCCFCLSGGLPEAHAEETEQVYVTFKNTTFTISGWEIFSDETCTNSLGKVGSAKVGVTESGAARLKKEGSYIRGYLAPGTYWVRGDWTSSKITYHPVAKITIPSGVTEFTVAYNHIYVNLNETSLITSLEDMGLNVDDYQLGGTAKLKRANGEVVSWTFQFDLTQGKEPYGQYKWYFWEQAINETYTVTYTPLNENFSSCEKELEGKTTGSSLRANFTSLWQCIRTFRIPAEYEKLFHLYAKTGNHYTPFSEYTSLSVETVVDGYVDISYALPQQCTVHYTIEHSDELGNIKLSRLRGFNRATPSLWVERGYSKVREDYISGTGLQSKNWVSFDLDNSLRLNVSAIEEANLYLNVDDSNYVTMAISDTTQLEAFRTWQAVGDVIGNYFIEPDFHYEIIGDSVSIKEKGAEGRRYVDVTAEKEGLSVIKVTYDAMYFGSIGVTMDPTAEGANSLYYDAIDPVNTRVVIVNVGATNTANIQPNIEQTEYDTIYFDDSKTDHAEYTFTPTVDAGHTLSVRVHDPLHNTDWDTAWTTYTAALDGSYTVNLKDGRNIIEIRAEDGSVEYYVVNCRALDIDIVNLTRPDATDYQQGDTIQIYFDGLTMPVQKMAGIYNPNFPDQGWVEYHTEDGDTVRSAGGQYNAVTRSGSKLTIELTEAGEYHLLNGQIHNTHLGSSLNTHRIIPLEGMGVNTDASSGENSPYFSTLPDISLTVKETPGYVPPEDPKKAAMNAVIALIGAIGDVTLDSRDAIEAARNAYDALDEALQAQITNYDKLTEAETAYAALTKPAAPAGEDEVTVSLTVTYGNDLYAPQATGEPIVQTTLTVPYFDLADYGLEKYYYNPNCYQGSTQTGGTRDTAEGKVTLLHALIYATEVLYEGMEESEAGQGALYDYNRMSTILNPTGNAGSLFFNPMWEFGYNLNYYVNYEYPLGRKATLAKAGIGATADQILLADGDEISLHGIKGSAAIGTAFSYFRLNGARDRAAVMQGNTATLRLYHAQTDDKHTGTGTNYTAGAKEKVYITSALTTDVSSWTELATTDGTGTVALDTSDLDVGTYYLATVGFDGKYETAPAVFVLTVKENPDKIAADKVIALIDAIGNVTLGSKDEIEDAREAYDALTSEQKKLVSNYDDLEAAEAKYAQLKKQVALAGAASILGGASEPKAEFPFTDVAGSAWYYESVKNAWENGLIDGMNATQFQPEGTLTVAQAVKLAAALHQMYVDGEVSLKNGTGNWYDTYVAYAVENRIIEEKYAGYTMAQMNAAITRAEFVHIFHGAMGSYYACNQVADNAIPDVKSGDAYADEIYEFYRAGILTGSDGKGTFQPASSIKRSEVATILIRMYDTNARQAITLG